MVTHAIVAVGASGGGLEPLRRITERLPRNCGVTVFVVMHSGAASFLPEILSWHGKLRVEFAREGDFISAGRIYVAPPDHHMGVEAGHIRLNKGPRVHSVRPAIDPMFASVAGAYGRRVMDHGSPCVAGRAAARCWSPCGLSRRYHLGSAPVRSARACAAASTNSRSGALANPRPSSPAYRRKHRRRYRK